MRVLYITHYSDWKLIVQTHSFPTYHKVIAANTRSVWAGWPDTIYHIDVEPGTDWDDWNATFESASTAVETEDDALAYITGFGRPLVPRSSDGTPLVATRALALGLEAFLRTDDGSEKLNVDGRASGTSVVLWNGSGISDAGGDWTVSGVGSQQAAADAGGGTNGWDSGSTGANTNTIFDNGSMINVGGTYAHLSFMLNPRTYPGNGKLQVQFRDNLNAVVGSTLDVGDYTANMDTNTWQQIQIPITDFALTGNVQKLYVVYKTGTQRHYIDNITLQAAGGTGPYTYQLTAPAGKCYHVSMMALLVAAPGAGWTASNFGGIAPLANGLLLRQRRISTGEILWKFNSRDNADLFSRYHPQDDIEFADGTLQFGFMVKPGKASVTVTEDDVLEFIVRDNLTGITEIRAVAHFGVEVVAT